MAVLTRSIVMHSKVTYPTAMAELFPRGQAYIAALPVVHLKDGGGAPEDAEMTAPVVRLQHGKNFQGLAFRIRGISQRLMGKGSGNVQAWSAVVVVREILGGPRGGGGCLVICESSSTGRDLPSMSSVYHAVHLQKSASHSGVDDNSSCDECPSKVNYIHNTWYVSDFVLKRLSLIVQGEDGVFALNREGLPRQPKRTDDWLCRLL